jgi:hypothetical protein
VSVPSATHNAAFSQSITMANYTTDGANPFRLRGGTPFNPSGFGSSTFIVESLDTSPAAGNLGTGGASCWYVGIEFEFEGTSLELQYFSGNNSMPMNIIVDGRALDYQPAIYGTAGTWLPSTSRRSMQ